MIELKFICPSFIILNWVAVLSLPFMVSTGTHMGLGLIVKIGILELRLYDFETFFQIK